MVWLQGKKYERKLLTQHIKRISPTDQQTYQDNQYAPADYFNHFYVNDEYKAAERSGVDKNANYADSVTHYVDYYTPL